MKKLRRAQDKGPQNVFDDGINLMIRGNDLRTNFLELTVSISLFSKKVLTSTKEIGRNLLYRGWIHSIDGWNSRRTLER